MAAPDNDMLKSEKSAVEEFEKFFKLVLFVGTHGTGKTATVSKLQLEKLIYLIDGVPRRVSRISSAEAIQNSILAEYLNHLLQIFHDYLVNGKRGTIIATNCALRFLGYVRADGLKDECRKAHEEIALWEQAIATKIFYFPIEVPLVAGEDLNRPLSYKYQKEVDQWILSYLNDFDVPFVMVSGDISQKVEIIQKELEGLI